MEIVDNTTATSSTVQIQDPFAPIWAAIVAKNETENWSSRRTIAIPNEGLVNCSLPNDVEVVQVQNDLDDFSSFCSESNDAIVSTIIRNFGSNPQSNFELSYFINGQDTITETFTGTIAAGEEVIYDFVTPLSITKSGYYMLTIMTRLVGDDNPANNEATINFYAIADLTSLNFEEGFETNSAIPEGWFITNQDNNITWAERDGIVGSDGNDTRAFFVNNYDYEDTGEIDIITTEVFDLRNTDDPLLTFDLAKALFSNSDLDGLRVEISVGCEENFSVKYNKEGQNLATLPNPESSFYVPENEAEWRNEQIDLSDYSGEVVQIRFVNINDFGNNTCLLYTSPSPRDLSTSRMPSSA